MSPISECQGPHKSSREKDDEVESVHTPIMAHSGIYTLAARDMPTRKVYYWTMRIVVAYDGSANADSIFADLDRAGLPSQADVLILTVAERRLGDSQTTPPSQGAEAIALKPLQPLRTKFPTWRIHSEGATGAPARRIVDRAREWKADLIVLGAVGHTLSERFMIGSVSYKVANEAHCAVRIARVKTNRLGGPVRILLGYDDLPASRMVVQAVAGRTWPAATRVILHAAVGFGWSPIADLILPEDHDRAQMMLEPAAKILRDPGLDVSATILEDDPKNSIVAAAQRVSADCIFIGDNDETALDRLLLGTVASAVVSRAMCSVEIIR